MVKIRKVNPRQTPLDITSYAKAHTGVHTARKRLKEAKLARRPSKKPLISKVNKKRRLDFARRYLHCKRAVGPRFVMQRIRV